VRPPCARVRIRLSPCPWPLFYIGLILHAPSVPRACVLPGHSLGAGGGDDDRGVRRAAARGKVPRCRMCAGGYPRARRFQSSIQGACRRGQLPRSLRRMPLRAIPADRRPIAHPRRTRRRGVHAPACRGHRVCPSCGARQPSSPFASELLLTAGRAPGIQLHVRSRRRTPCWFLRVCTRFRMHC
jgi:hypothetical protein